jgi:hypothetical protein
VLVGDTVRVPLAALLPIQLPEAVHEVALVEDQVTIEILPEIMLVGRAENATAGFADAANVDTAGSDMAGEVSTKGETAIIEASALASRALALGSEETKTERTYILPTESKAAQIQDYRRNFVDYMRNFVATPFYSKKDGFLVDKQRARCLTIGRGLILREARANSD